MPRNVDPGTIRVGKGLAPEGTVEDNSLRYPERDADPLRVHIHDPSRAHMASSIGIVDELDCYVSDEVEGALQELCGNSAAGRLNGLIAGGTFSELGCLPNGTAGGVHATLTLCSPTEILMNGTVFDATSLTVSVPAANTTYFIYLDTHPTSPTYRELVATTGSPPEVETGDPNATTGPGSIEHVMLAKVQMDAGGNVVEWQDARFFVRNLDRKVQYSSRQGENVDAWSEGCFANLQAFFFWAEYYGDGALPSSNEEEKGTVLVRGTHVITSTLTIPTDHLQFVGDGEAVIRLDTNAGIAAIESQRSDTTFRNIRFLCNGPAGCTAIAQSGAAYTDITIENCQFLNGTGSWSVGVSFGGGAGNARLLVRDCTVQFSGVGISATGFGTTTSFGIRVEGCSLQGQAGSLQGINLQSGSGAVVTGCDIHDVVDGLNIEVGDSVVSECEITDVRTGVVYPNVSQGHRLTDNRITLRDADSLHGVLVTGGATNMVISGNWIASLISGGHASAPLGIGLRVAKAHEYVAFHVTDNTVVGFWDDVGNVGNGIRIWADDTTGFGATVTGNILSRNNVSVEKVHDITLTGNIVDAQGEWGGAPGPTLRSAIQLVEASTTTITGNTAHCRATIPDGIALYGSHTHTVTGNHVLYPTGVGIFASAASPISSANAMEQFTIEGNTVNGWLTENVAPTAIGIQIGGSEDNGAPSHGVIDSNVIQKCGDGIVLRGFNTNILLSEVVVSNNQISECARDQDTFAENSWNTAGTKGIGLEYGRDVNIAGNLVSDTGIITNPDTGNPITYPNSIFPAPILALNSRGVVISGNNIRRSTPFSAGLVRGDIRFALGESGVVFSSVNNQIHDNTVSVNDSVRANKHIGIYLYVEDELGNEQILRETSVRGNTIHSVGGPSSDGVGAGVFLDAGSNASADGIAIENNTVESYISTGVGAQIGSATPVGDSRASNIRFRGNSMSSLDNFGVAGVFIGARSDSTFDTTVHVLSVEGNTTEGGWGTGVTFQLDAKTATTGVINADGIDIVGNRAYNLQPFGSVPAAGVYLDIEGQPTTGNIFTASPGYATPGISNLRIVGNHATNVQTGIDIKSLDCLGWQRLTVTGNQCFGSGTDTGVDDYLCRFVSDLTAVATATQNIGHISIADNAFEVDTSQDRSVIGLAMDMRNPNLSVLSVQNNSINSTGPNAVPASQAPAVSIKATGGAGSLTCQEWVISGNLLGGSLDIAATEVEIETLDVVSNQVTLPVLDAAAPTLNALNIVLDGNAAAGLQSNNLSFDDNTLKGGTGGGVLDFNDMDIETLSMSRNTVEDAYLNGISLAFEGVETGWTRNISITSNKIASNSTSGSSATGISYISAGVTQSFEVTGNHVYNQDVQGIKCLFGGEAGIAGTNTDRGIILENNVIDVVGNSGASLPVIELGVNPASDVSLAAISTVSISGNTLANCGSTAGTTAIYADLAPYQSAIDVRFDDNTTTQAGGLVSTRLGNGIELDLPTTTRMSVSRNQLRLNGFAAGLTEAYGVYLQCLDSTLSGISLDDNIITINSDADGGIRLRVLGSSDMSIEDMSISRNQIRSLTDSEANYGIRWSGEDGAGDYVGKYVNVHIDDNTVTSCRNGIYVDVSDDDDLHTSLDLINCSADRNSIQDCRLNGVYWRNGGYSGNGGRAWGFSACDNQVVTAYSSEAASFINSFMVGVFFGKGPAQPGGSNIHAVSVDRNHCYVVATSGPPAVTGEKWSGVFVEAAPTSVSNTVSTLSVDQNHVRNAGTNAVNLQVYGVVSTNGQGDIDGITKVITASVSGNLIEGAGTQWDPNNSNKGLLRIEGFLSVYQGLTVHGNNVRVRSDGGCALMMAFGSIIANPASSSVQNSHWSVQGNTIRGDNNVDLIIPNWGPIIAPGTEGAGMPTNSSVSQNINDNDLSGADNFNGTNWALAGYDGTGVNIQTNNLVVP